MAQPEVKLAIVGSRAFLASKSLNKVMFNTAVDKFIAEYCNGKTVIIITGDEPEGVDRLATEYANTRNLTCRVKVADWMRYGRAAGPLRNKRIVAEADMMLAFPSRAGKGTQDSIKQMTKLNKYVLALFVD